jgi:hypothetical protein
MKEYVVPVFYTVLATSPEEARDAVIGTIEATEYDAPTDEPGHFTCVLVGNEDEVTGG